MILLKIIIDNFRSHKHYVFEPALTGVTSISGENGAGKSTIVDSFSWSLFGTRLHNLKNKNYIRKGVNPKEELVQVQSFFIVGNREYKVHRQIVNESGTTVCSVFSREINSNEDFVFECGPAISHSENYIRSILGCDEKGFLSSVFIQQKQVDQIISASPKERGLVIEKLIGVDSITKAYDFGREESRALQKAAQIVQIGSIEDEQKKVEEQKLLVLQLKTDFVEKTKELKSNQEKFETKNVLYLQEKEKQKENRELLENIKLTENTIKHLQNQLQTELEHYSNIGGSNTKFSEDDLASLEQERKTLLQEEQKQKELFLSNKVNLDKLEELFSHKISKKAFDKHKEIKEKLENIDEQEKNSLLEIELSKEKIKNNNIFIEQLKKGNASCPICGNAIEDLDKELKIKQQENISLDKLIKDNKKQIKTNKEIKSDLLEDLIIYQNLIDVDKAQKEEEINYKKTKEICRTLEKQIKQIKKNLDITTKQLNKLILAKTNSDNIDKIKKNINSINKNLEEENKKLKFINEQQAQLNAITISEFNKLEKETLLLEKTIANQQNNLSKIELKLELSKQKGRELVESLSKCKKAAEEYKKLANQINIINFSTKTLSEFREDRIKKSIPKLTEIASEIFQKFTNGDFIEVKLTENFEAYVVTKDKDLMDVAQLSGGELSAVAISLRLAIALFLHEGTQSLLILDEVLVSMSEERSRLILETITSLTQAQIIIISHSNEINGFSDKIIYLS